MCSFRAVATKRTALWLVAAFVIVAGSVVSAAVLGIRPRAILSRRALTAAANALEIRVVEGRLSSDFEHRPLRKPRGVGDGSAEWTALREAALDLRQQWQENASATTARLAAIGLLLDGDTDAAMTLLDRALQLSTGEPDPLAAIRICDDPVLLIDFSAAALQQALERDHPHRLLLAYEAADRAWTISGDGAAAWNRAIASERIGSPRAAVRAWDDDFSRARNHRTGPARRRSGACTQRVWPRHRRRNPLKRFSIVSSPLERWRS